MKSIDLYKFVLGEDIWTYTSSNESVVYNGETYIPASIGRGNIESKSEISKSNLEISLSLSDELAQLLVRNYFDLLLSVTVFTQNDVRTVVSWKGRLSSIKPGVANVTLSVESIFTSLRRPGLRALYQKTCRHAVYFKGCKLNKEDFASSGRLLSISASLISINEASLQTDGYYLGGMVGSEDGSYRLIINHTGSFITMSRPLDFLSKSFSESGYGMSYGMYYGGISIKIYPGCDRSMSVCLNRFNNLDNHGGFPWIPSINPFGGSSIV